MKIKYILHLTLLFQSLNIQSQILTVYNPFEYEIDPSEFDHSGAEYKSEVIKIWGVVSGASQGGWSGHKLYTQQFIDIKSWKILGEHKARRSDLMVLRNVEKSHDFFKDIPKFGVIEIELFLNSTENRAVMLGGKVILNPDEEMIKEKEFVKSAKIISVDEAGDFNFNHDMQNFDKKLKWLKNEITVSIDINDESSLTDEIETLKKNNFQSGKIHQRCFRIRCQKYLKTEE